MTSGTVAPDDDVHDIQHSATHPSPRHRSRRHAPHGHGGRHHRYSPANWTRLDRGALWIAAGLLYAESGWRFRASSAVWLATDVVLAAGLVGLMVLRPHGPSRGAAVALIAALAARVLFAAAEVSGLVTGTENDVLLPMAALLTALSSVAYGAFARLADRRLRVASTVMGLYFFAVMLPFAITGEPNSLAIGGWGIPAALIGLAITRGTAPRD